MNKEIQAYNNAQSENDKAICDVLAQEINKNLPEAENKIWHAYPVWFLDGNPITGYSRQKAGIQPFKKSKERRKNASQKYCNLN